LLCVNERAVAAYALAGLVELEFELEVVELEPAVVPSLTANAMSTAATTIATQAAIHPVTPRRPDSTGAFGDVSPSRGGASPARSVPGSILIAASSPSRATIGR
jgi:hypothetical protein